MGTADLGEIRDRELLSLVRQGDEEAFRGLFRRYAPTALAVANRIVRKMHLAEETVQEAFLSLWRNPAGYDPARGSVRSYLLSTVHHRAVDLVRREEAQRRRVAEAIPEVPVEDHAATVVEDVGLQQEREQVRRALEDLPPEQRQVIELMYFGARSQSRIAEELGLPLGTVKSRTLLGMRRLRTALSGMER